MDWFSAEIEIPVEYRLVELESATDILRFSFIAQHSISPLDLAQWERYIPRNFRNPYIVGQSTSSVLDLTISYPKYLISTEEKCRKVLSRTRDFLYRLHLDSPKTLEFSLKAGIEPELMYRDSSHSLRHIGKIAVGSRFHSSLLTSYAKEAVERSDNKLRLIKWLMTFNTAERFFLRNQDLVFFVKHIRSIYNNSEVTDPACVTAFLEKLNLDISIVRNDGPKISEFFLRHYLKYGGINRPDPIEEAIRFFHFKKISAFLKYQDAPRVPPPDVVWRNYTFYRSPFAFLIHSLIPADKDALDEALEEAEMRMSPKRFYLMMQLFHIFSYCQQPPAAECLRLLWSSLPDPIFSFEEIETAFQTALTSEAIKEMYNFYSKAVGAIHEHVEPRSLKDLCRPVVRRMLWENGFWIPDGIKLTGVPIELQAFLNLEA